MVKSSSSSSELWVAFRLGLAVVVGVSACAEPPARRPRELAEPVVRRSPEEVYAPVPDEPQREEPVQQARAEEAFALDRSYAGDRLVPARRLVYRVTLRVPRNLGSGNAGVPSPAAELYIDVSRDRLRARFEGPGWPVPAGSEVRLRRDEPGVYVFDDEGGHALGPGQLAMWFEGGRLRREASVRVAVPDVEEQSGPGVLICRLIAEWSQVPPDSIVRRCGEGGAPPSFRVGLWRATRTADVGMQLPARNLRADHEDPPAPLLREESHVFLPDRLLRRLRRIRGARAEPADDAPPQGLVIQNGSPARMILTIGGTPVAWIDSGSVVELPGILAGSYPVGAMRPLGLQTAQKRPRVVPGSYRLPR